MQWTTSRVLILALACSAGLVLPGCGRGEPPAQPGAVGEAPLPPPVEQASSAAESPWTPEALEDLLAPIALYPDPVLAQVLATSTNPQEVLDAGNWLIQNPNLSGKDLESAATAAGFTPPMIALVQFPTVVDMMCMQMAWTSELGTAFRADEPGVLDAVQRLRKQAVDMGNLSSSEQLKVSTEEHQGQQVVVVQPAQPQVVYVPQYDPQTVYTQPAPAPAATTTTETGHSTGALITTGLLAFGAGILVNEAFDDDDDDDWDYPHWGYGYGGPPYYPPPYRPVYGGGYRPGYGYNRPPNYQHGFNNNNIYVNAGDDYWNRFDTDRRNNYRNNARSPISQARPNRPELQNVNSQLRSRPAGTRKGREGYAGASRPQAGQQPRDRPAAAGAAKPAVSGSYAGAKDRQAAARVQQNAPAGARDRGRTPQRDVAQASRPQTPAGARTPQQRPASRPAPMREQGLQRSRESGQAERAASQRGRQSMPQGARKQPKAQQRSGGGGQRKRGK